MRPITQEDVAYFDELTTRYPFGIYPIVFDFIGSATGNCHENAEAFFRQFPDHPVVSGWLATELGNAPGYFRFVAHSINRRPDGRLMDVTPLSETDRKAYRFIEHLGTGESFRMLRNKFPDAIIPFISPPDLAGTNSLLEP